MESVRTRTAGGIVLGDAGTIALVRTTGGAAWTFPKGHINAGETDEEAARREIQEETGITELEYLDDLGSFERYRIGPRGDDDDLSELKEVHLFLFAAPPGSALSPSMEIGEARWVPYREAVQLLTHAKERAWYGNVFERVREAIQRD